MASFEDIWQIRLSQTLTMIIYVQLSFKRLIPPICNDSRSPESHFSADPRIL